MPKAENYLDIVKKANPKGNLGEQLQTIAKRMEDSRQGAKKNILERIPKHVKVLQSGLKDLNVLRKEKNADKNDLKKLDEIIEQVQSDIRALNKRPDIELATA